MHAQSVIAPTNHSSNDEDDHFDADCMSIKSSLFAESECPNKPEIEENNYEVEPSLTTAERESFFAPVKRTQLPARVPSMYPKTPESYLESLPFIPTAAPQ